MKDHLVPIPNNITHAWRNGTVPLSCCCSTITSVATTTTTVPQVRIISEREERAPFGNTSLMIPLSLSLSLQAATMAQRIRERKDKEYEAALAATGNRNGPLFSQNQGPISAVIDAFSLAVCAKRKLIMCSQWFTARLSRYHSLLHSEPNLEIIQGQRRPRISHAFSAATAASKTAFSIGSI